MRGIPVHPWITKRALELPTSSGYPARSSSRSPPEHNRGSFPLRARALWATPTTSHDAVRRRTRELQLRIPGYEAGRACACLSPQVELCGVDDGNVLGRGSQALPLLRPRGECGSCQTAMGSQPAHRVWHVDFCGTNLPLASFPYMISLRFLGPDGCYPAPSILQTPSAPAGL